MTMEDGKKVNEGVEKEYEAIRDTPAVRTHIFKSASASLALESVPVRALVACSM
jgi:hypothetical protein